MHIFTLVFIIVAVEQPTTYAVAFHSLFKIALSLALSLSLSPYDTLKHFGVNIL